MIEAEINGERIFVWFRYNPADTALAQRLPGARFVPADKGGPCWSVPKDADICRTMRQVWGDRIRFTDELKAWGWGDIKSGNRLTSLAAADDAELVALPKHLPRLFQALRGYQRAGVKFAATQPNPLVADEPGLGKTLMTIGAVYESETWNGPQLVIAPLTALESVWEYELLRWLEGEAQVIIVKGDRANRWGTLDAVVEFAKEKHPFWVVINHKMASYESLKDPDNPQVTMDLPTYPQLQDVVWDNIIVDECHKGVLNNPKTLTAKGLSHLHGDRRMALSGTPIGGKPINLWGILHWLEPKKFSSKWRWADQWLEVTDTGWGKKISGIRKDREEEFYKHLNPYMLRRKKSEVLPELPPKHHQTYWVEMEPEQAKQYREFALMAEVKIEDFNLGATSILAEYTRLKQFAIAKQKILEWKPGPPPSPVLAPTFNSCKLPVIQQILEELGVWDADTDEQCVIFSQFSRVVDMIHEWLTKKGVPTNKLTGDTTQSVRKSLIQDFQKGSDSPVLVMTTTAGGTAITLDRASTVIFTDETWNPDDQLQAEDRVHRASRLHQVNVYKIKTKDTLEEYIERVLDGKRTINDQILDIRRKGLRSFHRGK